MNGNEIDTLDTQDQILELKDFSGGLNIKSADFLVKDNQATERLNCHSDETGAVVKRNGRQYLNSAEIVAGKGIYGLYKFYKSPNLSYFLAGCNTDLYLWSGTAWGTLSQTLTVNSRFDFATYDVSNICLICNGVNAPMTYDGASVSAMGGSPPATMAAVIIHRNRAFAYTPNSSYLYCSALGNMESWDTTNWKWSVGSTTGDFLTGFGVLSGYLVLFKQNSVRLFMTDGDRTGWQMGDPLTTKGCIARHSICNAMIKGKPVLIYLSADGVYAFDGYGSFSLTENDIDPIFTSASYTYKLNRTNADTSVGEVHNNKYYLSYPYGSGSAPNRTLVFDLINGGWSVFDYGVRCFCEFRGKGSSRELYSGLTATGYVVREDYGDYDLTDDSDGDITMTYKSKYFAPAGANIINQFWKYFCRAEPSENTTLRTALDTDFGKRIVEDRQHLSIISAAWDDVNWDEFEWGGGSEIQLYNKSLEQRLVGKQIAVELYNKDWADIKVHYVGVKFTPEYFDE